MKATSSAQTPARRALPVALTAALLTAPGLGLWWAMQALVIERAVGEGRAVADMAENVGRWASQYGGVHVRTQGLPAKLPGSFLTRSVYNDASEAAAHADSAAGGAGGTGTTLGERAAMERMEAYYWKNPATGRTRR